MGRIIYPFSDNYTNWWYTVKQKERETVFEYVNRALGGLGIISEEQAEKEGMIWARITVVDTTGAKYTGGGSVYYGAVHMVDEKAPSHVMIHQMGYLSIFKMEKLTVTQIAKNLFHSMIRTMQVMLPLGSIAGIETITTPLKSLQMAYDEHLKPLIDRFQPIYARYQKVTAWVSRTIHYDLLKKSHEIGRIISPDYDEYWKEQESELTDLSVQIFGDGARLAGYVHLLEMVYVDAALRAGKDKDTARQESMQASAKQLSELRKNIESYKRNPYKVWTYLMRESFGDGNPYLNASDKLDGAEIFSQLGSLGESIKELKAGYDRYAEYQKALEEVGLPEIRGGIEEVATKLNNYYDETLAPVFRKIEAINELHDRILNTLNEARKAEQRQRERAYLLSTPPAELSDANKAMQRQQVSDLFNETLLKDIPEDRTFRTDIDKLLEVIYESD